MPNANLYFKFVDSTSKAGKTGLTVTANVYKLTKSGTKTTVATAASCSEVGGGLYSYNLSSPDFATYDYVATAIPSDTTGLANADADALWADFSPDVQSRVPAALTADGNIKADTLRITGTTQTARDIGASVLLSSGAGTGQISLSSGAVLLQPTQTGVTIPTVTNLTTLPTAPTDWLTAAAVKADAVTKIQSGLLLSASYAPPLSASGVRDAVGLASNDLDSQLGNILSAASAPGSTPPTASEIATQVFSTVLPGSFAPGTAGYTIYNRLTAIKLKTDTITTLDDLLTALSDAHGDGQWDAVGEGGGGGTVDLSAVLAAQASAQAALVRIQAAVYDTARVSGNVIFMSDGHTQRMTAGGRQTV